MKWTENEIAAALVQQFFNGRYLVAVPKCGWAGSEADLLAVTNTLRLIDLEIKISRADLKADAKKYKWKRFSHYGEDGAVYEQLTHPQNIWKHYYVMPQSIWKPELADGLPSKASGILLLSQRGDRLTVCPARAAKADRHAKVLSSAEVVDIARLATLRMWAALRRDDEAFREKANAENIGNPLNPEGTFRGGERHGVRGRA